jgi:methylglyoxal synthase
MSRIHILPAGRNYPVRRRHETGLNEEERNMDHKAPIVIIRKNIAVIAHDNKKQDLLEWAKFNRNLLERHQIYCTGTTGTLLERELGLPVNKLQSGPLGGDLQIGAMTAEGNIDFLIFFWDPLEPHPHDTDVKALLRIAVVWNVPIACNRASADFMVSSPLMSSQYERSVPDYGAYKTRLLKEQKRQKAVA